MGLVQVDQKSSKGSLESCVVVQSDLIGDVVLAVVHKLVIGSARSSQEGTSQLLRVGSTGRGLRPSTTASGGARARAVMGADWRVNAKADHETAASGSKGVVNLALGEGNICCTVNAGISSLKEWLQ